MTAKRIIRALLLGFVLVSIGFAVGKEAERSRLGHVKEAPGSAVEPQGPDKVIVYYMHASFRCLTCNLVESMGQELVRTEFAGDVAAGRLEWKAVNYQEDEELATKYNVGGNMIVVAKFRAGKEVEHRRLDRVMELAGKRDEFMAYVRAAVKDLLGGQA